MQGAVVHFVNLGSGPKTETMRRSQALLAHRAFADVTTEIASIILHCNGAFGAEAGFSPQPRPSRSAHGRSRRRPEVNRRGCGRPVPRRRVGRGLGLGESSRLTARSRRDRMIASEALYQQAESSVHSRWETQLFTRNRYDDSTSS